MQPLIPAFGSHALGTMSAQERNLANNSRYGRNTSKKIVI